MNYNTIVMYTIMLVFPSLFDVLFFAIWLIKVSGDAVIRVNVAKAFAATQSSRIKIYDSNQRSLSFKLIDMIISNVTFIKTNHSKFLLFFF